MPCESFFAERLSADTLAEFVCCEFSSMDMDLFFEPFSDKEKVATGNFAFPVGKVFCKHFEKLGGEEVAQCVGGKVADQPARPVDILKTAFFKGGGCDIEVLLHEVIPQFRDLFHRERAFHEFFFDFKAEDDMEVIGDLIGFDADTAGSDCIDGLVEGV